MSSSLLIILLVVVWLFVLAPMLIRSRNPIRRTGDALAETRTLYAGGSSRLVPSRGRAAPDPVQAETDEALFGLPSGDGATDAELLDVETWADQLERTLRREAAGRRGEAARRAMEERRAVPAREADEEITTEIPTVGDGAGVAGAVIDHDDRVEEVRAPYVVDGELVERPAVEREAEPVDHSEDAAGIDEEAALLHRGRRRHHEPEVELTDADIDFAERRRGRGAYDPMADREAAEQRAHARQRTALILAAVAAVSVVAALLGLPGGWWVAGGAAVLLAAYLAYLRRQVRLEESLRRRRVERMRRARLGVESREDAELSVVPPRLRRPGAVVLEVDDEDPAFDVLELHHDELDTDPGRHDRRAPRRPEHREPLRRAVG
ncbi:gephyrin-like molybdotransferase receptor GlpR [Dietzia sp. 179-F 9C3 NHS]|uniref:divisome protein SepX/GlpR n=1 Tax=Dietzia sp. 179-F 9C3 NHS TaxID=3374295 RepID=UPI00387967AB